MKAVDEPHERHRHPCSHFHDKAACMHGGWLPKCEPREGAREAGVAAALRGRRGIATAAAAATVAAAVVRGADWAAPSRRSPSSAARSLNLTPRSVRATMLLQRSSNAVSALVCCFRRLGKGSAQTARRSSTCGRTRCRARRRVLRLARTRRVAACRPLLARARYRRRIRGTTLPICRALCRRLGGFVVDPALEAEDGDSRTSALAQRRGKGGGRRGRRSQPPRARAGQRTHQS